MRTSLAVLAVIFLAAMVSFAQEKATPRPTSASGPTKVTGKPTTQADGLQYWDIKVGTGKTAQKGDTVTVNYTGWLTDGTKASWE